MILDYLGGSLNRGEEAVVPAEWSEGVEPSNVGSLWKLARGRGTQTLRACRRNGALPKP